MTRCLSIDELERALDDSHESETLRVHLADCAKCRHRARRIEDNNGFLRTLRNFDSGGLDAAARASNTDGVRSIPEIEGFELLREIHRGGQGVVYLARQKATKRTVAIKMLLSATLATSRQRRRFEREIEIAAGLRHPQIVTVFESGATSDGWLWFAMEYVDGVPLNVYLKERRPSMAEVLQLVSGVCETVAYAHQRGIIHRDLKPANILVDHEGVPRVLDFGLAKEAGAITSDTATHATQAGEFMGTFAYAAPEQFKGVPSQIDTRTDVYALGTILYEAITGQHPFPTTGSLPEFIRAVDDRDVVHPSAHVKGLSAELEAIVLCALAAEPARRYQSAGAMSQDLMRYIVGEPVEARRDSHWYLLRKAAHRHRIAMTIVSLLVLVAIAFAILVGLHARGVAFERDKALSAEKEMARAAQTLAIALRQSNIERGRLLMRSGNPVMGERMVWREWLTSPVAREDSTSQQPDDEAYWALWEHYSASPCRQTVRLGEEDLTRFSINRDGRLLAGGAVGGGLKLWKLPEITLERDLGSLSTPITVVALAPNGNIWAAGDEQGNISLWETSPDGLIQTRRFSVLTTAVRSICFTGEDDKFAVLCGGYKLSAWHTDGSPLEVPGLAKEGPRLVAAMDHRLAVAMDDTMVVADLEGAEPIIKFGKAQGAGQRVTAIRFADEGRSLALGRVDGSIEVWDLAPPQLRWKNRLHHAAVLVLDYSPDGAQVASGGRDRIVSIWSARDGRVSRTLDGHASMVTNVCFIEDAKQLASASSDGQVKIWELDDLPAERVIAGTGGTVFHAAISPDGSHLISCSANGAELVNIADPNRSSRNLQLAGHQGIVSGGRFSPDGELLATTGYDHEVRLWRVSNTTCEAVLKGHEDYVESVVFCLDGSRIATASDDATVRLWDIASQKCVAVLRGHTDRCPMVAVSTDGETLASCSIDTTIRLWSARDGSPRGVLTGHAMPIRAVCFTPDGRYLLSGGDESSIRVWDVATQQCIATFEGSDQDIFCIAVSPDGRFVVSTTRGGIVQLWSLAQHRALALLTQEKAGIYSACFSPDGKSIYTGGEGGFVRRLDLTYFDAHIKGNRAVQEASMRAGERN